MDVKKLLHEHFSKLGRKGYKAKLKKLGKRKIREHARKVGKLGGRPKKADKKGQEQ